MKANRLNLCTSIRLALLAAGYSTVRIVNSVNAELGKLVVKDTESKTGASRITGKGTEFAVSTSTSTKYLGKLTMPLYFDAWHSAIAKVEKIAPFPKDQHVPIPAPFVAWFEKIGAKADKKVLAEESALEVESEDGMKLTIAEVQPEVAAK